MGEDYALKAGSTYELALSREEFEKQRLTVQVRDKATRDDLPNRTVTLYTNPAANQNADVEIKRDGNYQTVVVRLTEEAKRQAVSDGRCEVRAPGISIDILVR